MSNAPVIKAFFDKNTYTVTYIIHDPVSLEAAIIDSVLDFDPKSGRTSTNSADELIEYLNEHKLSLKWVLETHVHADHVTASQYLTEKCGGKIGISDQIVTVQKTFAKIFNTTDMAIDGSQFDTLFKDGDVIQLGELEITIMHTPGHTPACICYVMDGHIFVGDTVFMPDSGTARCDFPGGDAKTLYQSIQKILDRSDETIIHLCHDYGAGGKRDICWETTVGDEREKNIHLKDKVDEAQYIDMRETRDAQLAMPVLLLPAIQINMRAGHFPPADENGISYLKLPLNAV